MRFRPWPWCCGCSSPPAATRPTRVFPTEESAAPACPDRTLAVSFSLESHGVNRRNIGLLQTKADEILAFRGYLPFRMHTEQLFNSLVKGVGGEHKKHLQEQFIRLEFEFPMGWHQFKPADPEKQIFGALVPVTQLQVAEAVAEVKHNNPGKRIVVVAGTLVNVFGQASFAADGKLAPLERQPGQLELCVSTLEHVDFLDLSRILPDSLSTALQDAYHTFDIMVLGYSYSIIPELPISRHLGLSPPLPAAIQLAPRVKAFRSLVNLHLHAEFTWWRMPSEPTPKFHREGEHARTMHEEGEEEEEAEDE